jgi:regulator of protease activity HflC (stomatin/prohibitin superfamily)
MTFNRKLIIMIIFAFAIVLMRSTIVVSQEDGGKIAITGTVDQTDTGFVIMGDDGEDYYVVGKDLSTLIGKDVEAVGTVTQNEEGVKTLHLITVKEVE